MRFVRRRDAGPAADRPAEPDAAPDVEPAPRPPGGEPAAVFGGVLDGRHLWVAVAERPGHLALRDPAAGVVLAAEASPTEAQAGWLDARLDLGAAFASLADGAERLDVVVVPPGTAASQPVWAPPLGDLPGHGPVPEADDGAAYALERTPDGLLRVRRRDRRAGSRLRAIGDVGPHTARLVLDDVPGDGTTTLDLVRDDTVLASWPLEPDGAGRHDVVLDARGLPGSAWATDGRATLVTAGTGAPVWRRRNDLDAGPVAALPELASDAVPGAPGGRLRLRWSADGRLLARVLPDVAPAEGTEGGA